MDKSFRHPAFNFVVAVVCFCVGAGCLGSLVSRSPSVRLRYRTVEAPGHSEKIASLYFGSRRLADDVDGYVRSPANDFLLLYSTRGEDGGGTFFYDGRKGVPFRLGPHWDSVRLLPERVWAPTGRFVVVSLEDELRVFDIQGKSVTSLSSVLFANGVQRHLTFLSWSTDGSRLAVSVGGSLQQPAEQQDLLEVGAAGGWHARYVASKVCGKPYACWRTWDFEWRSVPPNGYQLVVAAPVSEHRIFVDPTRAARPPGNG